MTTVTTPHPRLRRTLIALTATTALALTGCGGDEEPGTGASETESASPSASESKEPKEPERDKETEPPAAAEEVAVDVAIVGDDVTPVAQSVELGVDETLLLRVDSDRAGELHVHSSPEQFVNFAAGASRLDLTFDKPGSVDIEEHDSGALIVRVLVK